MAALFFSSGANAGGTINYDYVDLLLIHIELSTGMISPKRGETAYPRILYVQDKVVHELVCGKKRTCSAWAATKSNMIFLTKNVRLNEPEGDSILYHELVHIVQNATFGAAQECREWADREAQAYMLQYRYAKSKGLDMDWVFDWIELIRNRCRY